MDQLGAMRIFVKVVQMGSFSAVGQDLDTSQATISKKISALESQLRGKLLNRTSREISLTEIGAEYYDKCVTILTEIDEADAKARSQIASPNGVLKVAAPVPFSHIVLAPLIQSFTTLYPDINVKLAASDHFVDLIAEGIDVAIRAKEVLEDTSLIARHLFNNPMTIVASPEYLEKHGIPTKPQDLKHHNCIVYSLLSNVNIWQFTYQGNEITVPVKGNFQSNNGDTNLAAAIAGLGITDLPTWMINDHIKAGRLQPILTDYKAISIPFNILYPQNRYIPLKVRCFVDFIKEKINENPIFT